MFIKVFEKIDEYMRLEYGATYKTEKEIQTNLKSLG